MINVKLITKIQHETNQTELGLRPGRWQGRRTPAHLTPWAQLGNRNISTNNPENNPESGRTNSTTKGKEEATSNWAGRVEMQWGIKQALAVQSRAGGTERVRNRLSHVHGEDQSP